MTTDFNLGTCEPGEPDDPSLSDTLRRLQKRSRSTIPRPVSHAETFARSQPAGYLARTIEDEIVPRLVLSRRAGESADDRQAALDDSDVEALAKLLLTQDATVAMAFVELKREQGASLSAVYLDLLAPTARRLGDWWHEDRCSFVDVTLGLCSLHRVLHNLSPRFVGESSNAGHGKRILLMPAPGEQHTFGLIMVVEFFRRSGWEVRFDDSDSIDDLARLVRREWFSVVGVSVGCDARVSSVAQSIRSLRKASSNRSLGVMVGGPLLTGRPDLVQAMGADATAHDGIGAVRQAEQVLQLLAART
jgi:methanogenic corrinoid protein MtbC1